MVRTCCGSAAALLFWALRAGAAPAVEVEVASHPERGYTLGEVIAPVLTLTVPRGYTLETGFLPRPGALDEWLEVRSVEWSRDEVATGARYRIQIAYQIFRGVRGDENVLLPGLPLRFNGPENLELKAPDWPFIASPLIPPNLPDEAVVIRDESPPEPRPMAGHWRRLWLGVAAALGLSAGLAWLRLDFGLRGRPFGRAQLELTKLRRDPASPETFPAAARLVHRALNETAGQAVFAGGLEPFCAARPAFAELKDDLAGFFRLSQQVFFTAADTPPPPDYPLDRLADLCLRCAAAERSGS